MNNPKFWLSNKTTPNVPDYIIKDAEESRNSFREMRQALDSYFENNELIDEMKQHEEWLRKIGKYRKALEEIAAIQIDTRTDEGVKEAVISALKAVNIAKEALE